MRVIVDIFFSLTVKRNNLKQHDFINDEMICSLKCGFKFLLKNKDLKKQECTDTPIKTLLLDSTQKFKTDLGYKITFPRAQFKPSFGNEKSEADKVVMVTLEELQRYTLNPSLFTVKYWQLCLC